MMEMTNGVGCAENETFGYPSDLVCCENDLTPEEFKRTVHIEQLAPNVCSVFTSIARIAPTPECMCKEGLDFECLVI